MDEFFRGGLIGGTSVAIVMLYHYWIEGIVRRSSLNTSGQCRVAFQYKIFVALFFVMSVIAVVAISREMLVSIFLYQLVYGVFIFGFIFFSARFVIDSFLVEIRVSPDGLNVNSYWRQYELGWGTISRVKFNRNFDVFVFSDGHQSIRVSKFIHGIDDFLRLIKNNVRAEALVDLQAIFKQRGI